ncbi:hypothetical protein MRX96_003806 [Rhipicephalus microplus]
MCTPITRSRSTAGARARRSDAHGRVWRAWHPAWPLPSRAGDIWGALTTARVYNRAPWLRLFPTRARVCPDPRAYLGYARPAARVFGEEGPTLINTKRPAARATNKKRWRLFRAGQNPGFRPPRCVHDLRRVLLLRGFSRRACALSRRAVVTRAQINSGSAPPGCGVCRRPASAPRGSSHALDKLRGLNKAFVTGSCLPPRAALSFRSELVSAPRRSYSLLAIFLRSPQTRPGIMETVFGRSPTNGRRRCRPAGEPRRRPPPPGQPDSDIKKFLERSCRSGIVPPKPTSLSLFGGKFTTATSSSDTPSLLASRGTMSVNRAPSLRHHHHHHHPPSSVSSGQSTSPPGGRLLSRRQPAYGAILVLAAEQAAEHAAVRFPANGSPAHKP